MEEEESEQFGIWMVMDSRKKNDMDKRIKCTSESCMTYMKDTWEMNLKEQVYFFFAMAIKVPNPNHKTTRELL